MRWPRNGHLSRDTARRRRQPERWGEYANGTVYVGCGQGNAHLQLIDSTISGNTGASTTGAWGDVSTDKLDLINTILTANPGGADVTGFQSISADHSDTCLNGGPLPGAGNICADPKLAATGPGSADVHQTFDSPTIDAGSNGAVPGDLTSALYGGPRVLDFKGGGAIVDIGADEIPLPDPTSSQLKLSIPSGGKISKTVPVSVGCQIVVPSNCDGALTADALLIKQGKKISSARHRKAQEAEEAQADFAPGGGQLLGRQRQDQHDQPDDSQAGARQDCQAEEGEGTADRQLPRQKLAIRHGDRDRQVHR